MRKRDAERAYNRTMKNLAEQVRTRRGETAQREFSRQTGFDQGSLSRIESRKAKSVSLAAVVRLAGAFGCEPAELLQPVSAPVNAPDA